MKDITIKTDLLQNDKHIVKRLCHNTRYKVQYEMDIFLLSHFPFCR